MIKEFVIDKNPDFSSIEILSWAGLTIPSLNLANYVCTAFTILDYLLYILMPSLADGTAAEHVLFHIRKLFESFICEEYKEKEQKFISCAAINIYFNVKKIYTLTLSWKIM